MTPYYRQDGITIYHGDCAEILPSLQNVDHVLTDPPYGINASRDRDSAKWGWVDYGGSQWDAQRPSTELLRAILDKGKHSIIWGANYFIDALPWKPKQKWLIWDKCQTEFSLADAELAWCSWEGAIRRFSYARALALKDGKQHPTQKPVELMKWCIGQFPERGDILDPFMGSGTTLVAAKALNLRAVGIEREERYCEIAALRLRQGTLPMEMAG